METGARFSSLLIPTVLYLISIHVHVLECAVESHALYDNCHEDKLGRIGKVEPDLLWLRQSGLIST